MDENELIKRAMTDELAVEEILNLYKPLVAKIARRYSFVGGELDDLMQEGMIALYKATKTFDCAKDASFKTFATLCINRRFQSVVRSANTKKNRELFDLIDFNCTDVSELPEDSINPEQEVISKQKFEHINSEISNRLSKFEKEILKNYLNGETYNQIAEKCNITKKSVDNALARIRTKLAYLLDDSEY